MSVCECIASDFERHRPRWRTCSCTHIIHHVKRSSIDTILLLYPVTVPASLLSVKDTILPPEMRGRMGASWWLTVNIQPMNKELQQRNKKSHALEVLNHKTIFTMEIKIRTSINLTFCTGTTDSVAWTIKTTVPPLNASQQRRSDRRRRQGDHSKHQQKPSGPRESRTTSAWQPPVAFCWQ